MRLTRVVVSFATLAVTLCATVEVVGCTGSSPWQAPPDAGVNDASIERKARRVKDGSVEVASADADAGADVGPPALLELHVTAVGPGDAAPALRLVPKFSPGVYDYYVRCAPGENTLSVSMTAAPGAESLLVQPLASPELPEQTVAPLRLFENQAIVAAATASSGTVEYWVRCLPHDFPDLRMETYGEAGAPVPGYYLLGTFDAPTYVGYAMVLNGDGVPVWYGGEAEGGVSDVDSLVANAISFAPVTGGPFEVHGLSPPAVTYAAPAGNVIDFHELRVLPNGHFIVISNPILTGIDLTGLSLPGAGPDGGAVALGPNSSISTCNIVEFDPASGSVVWTWKAIDHFDPARDCTEPQLTSAYWGGPTWIDTFHCNSIDVDTATGNLLVSARHMDSVFLVERATGRVVWKMGGAAASLDDATYVQADSPFYGQHDARLASAWSSCGGKVSLFDDETFGSGNARAVVYDVTLAGVLGGSCGGGDAGATPRATLAWQYVGSLAVQAGGSFRTSADGSRVIGWGLGGGPLLTELNSSGRVSRELDVPLGSRIPMESYRAIKVPLGALDLEAMREAVGLP